MCPSGQRSHQSFGRIRAEVSARLEARRPEIEEAILARLYAVSNPLADGDAEYLAGLRAAVTAAVDYGLAGIERGDERSGSVPAAMLAQARQAASARVSLETVLRRYFAGYTVMADFLMEECRHKDGLAISATLLHRLQKQQAALFDRLVTTVSAEYRHEAEHAMRTLGQRLTERVKRLLAGELVDTAELDYDFDAWHLGMIASASASASGAGAELQLRELAASLGRSLLLVDGGGHTLWAWLGGTRRVSATEITRLASIEWPADVSLAFGEPRQGIRGWRLTHRQAQAAMTVALRRPRLLTSYADVALLVPILRDDDLVAFLAETYLAPLSMERSGGETLRKTLRAYFAANRQVSSTAAALAVTRQTVTNRLRAVERCLDRPLHSCGAEMEAALQLEDIAALDTPLP